MLVGVNTLADAVKATLGPKGRNIILEKSSVRRLSPKTVSQSQKKSNWRTDLRIWAHNGEGSCSQASDVAGTNHDCNRSRAINRERRPQAVAAGMNLMDLKRGIDKAVAAAVEAVSGMASACEDNTAIARRYHLSKQQYVIEIIAEAMEKVGKEGVITVEEGSGLENELDVVEGGKHRGYLSPFSSTSRQHVSDRILRATG